MSAREAHITVQQGTGLVKNYGGRIWAENRIEGGAVLRFTLPLLWPV